MGKYLTKKEIEAARQEVNKKFDRKSPKLVSYDDFVGMTDSGKTIVSDPLDILCNKG